MARFGIKSRLTLAILLTALIPVLVAIWLVETTVRQTSARFFVPEVGARLDRSLGLYQELARAVKAEMRAEARALGRDAALVRAVRAGDAAAAREVLTRAVEGRTDLVSLTVTDGERVLAEAHRGRALDPARENRFQVVRELSPADATAPPVPRSAEPGKDDEGNAAGLRLTVVFAAEKARFDELSEASQFVDVYRRIEERRSADERAYVLAFAALLGITIVGAVGVGSFIASGVSRRVVALEAATRRVALGDLAVRVPEAGNDELAHLARAFNRMLGEVLVSRARIEYLQRISAWQEMARRLAHEIKNPLTPIQLAVQDIHRRYDGASPEYRALLDTTLEVVEDEVGTLRRLVGEFSDFARLPRAELERADLAVFLRELAEQPLLGDDERLPNGEARGDGPRVTFDIPEGEAPAEMDRQMLRRAVINLVRNAAQALGGKGCVVVRLARRGDVHVLDVEDDGPGISPELREAIFDPYVTTKTDGTGLGLSIVKKIVVEHRGSITAGESPLGGARLRIELPVASAEPRATLGA